MLACRSAAVFKGAIVGAPQRALAARSASLRGRFFASTRAVEIVETTQGVLDQLMPDGESGNDGRVLMTQGSTLRCSLLGPQTAIGRSVSLGGRGEGVVLRFDRRGAIVGPICGQGIRSGDEVVLGDSLVLHAPKPLAGGLVFASVTDLLRPGGPAGGDDALAHASRPRVMRLPRLPPPTCRRPVQRRLPSGLAAVEALMPLGEGHRVGLVGPPGTGKSSAVRMLIQSQPAGTAVVYGAYGTRRHLEAKIGSTASEAALTVVHADASDTATARYLMPLCALHLATELRKSHRHVLLVLDDLVAFAYADAELGVPPLRAPHILASALDGAGCVETTAFGPAALSVVAVLDVAPEDEMHPQIKDLFRNAEQSFDVILNFDISLVAENIMPAIDTDLLAHGFAAPYQAPLMRLLRAELVDSLRGSKALRHRLDGCRELGILAEVDEEEELRSSCVSRALLAHYSARPLQELIVLICAALVYHFPVPRSPSSTSVAIFQEAVIACIRDAHPALWNSVGIAEGLDDADAAEVISHLGQVLLAHRLDFQLTRSE